MVPNGDDGGVGPEEVATATPTPTATPTTTTPTIVHSHHFL
jgi:hypothetical protein